MAQISYLSSNRVLIVRDTHIKEYYHFNEEGNNTKYFLEEFGKVTKAEQYDYKAYISERTDSVPNVYLNNVAYNESYVFTYKDYEETVLDDFNNPKTVKQHSRIGLNLYVDTETTYDYDNEHRCERAVTMVKHVNSLGTIREYKHIVEYCYNSAGKTVRKVGYIEGEELTAGKSIEETVYDNKGNIVKSYQYNSLDSSSKFYVESQRAENGRTIAEKDETGAVSVSYEYEEGTDNVRTEKYANGGKLSYGRDADGTVTSLTQSTEAGEENSTQTRYTCGEITELVSGNNTVNYKYDEKRRIKEITLNGKTYETYQYAEGSTADDADVVTLINAKGELFVTEQNKLGTFKRARFGENALTENEYDKFGQVTTVDDFITGSHTTYIYDDTFFDKLKTVSVSAGTDVSDVTESYSYDNDGSLTGRVVSGAASQNYTYHYNSNATHTLEYLTLPNGMNSFPQTDVNGRNTGKELKTTDGVRRFGEYLYYRKEGDHATNMPSAVYFGSSPNGKYEIKDNIKYKYDNMGNVAEIKENGVLFARYFYDSLNRLVREDNKKLGKTWLYSYDNNGNILCKREFAFALRETNELEEFTETSMIEYSYDGDRLMRLEITDGAGTREERFAYDEIGNPTVYRGAETVNTGWERGRLLNMLNGNSYRYDGRGRRIKRNNTVFTYDSQGNLIKSSDGLEFFYDSNGVCGVTHSNTTYYYRKDAQGNIIALLDNAGKIVVKYVYDAWGNHAVLNGNGEEITEVENIGHKNPFRYRGYYYDECTGLYYLQTRYYDPEVGRFITIDAIEYLDPESINGLNLYAYCGDNPVMGYDPDGTWDWDKFWKALLLIVTAVAAIAISVATFGAGTPLAMTLVAGVTLAAGILTGINGVATMVEAGTGYNFVRDGVFQGNETAYDWYAGITEGLAVIGTMILSVYNMTGRAKAVRMGRKFLGKGYKKVGAGRWVSQDGMRQMRFDTPHPYKGEMLGKHINLDVFKVNYWENARVHIMRNKGLHLVYKLFKLIIK